MIYFFTRIYFLNIYKMAGLINPQCNLPMYQQTDVDIVQSCSRMGSYISSGVITLTTMIGMTIFYFSLKHTKDKNPTESQSDINSHNNKLKIGFLVSFILLMLAVWLLLPFLSGLFAKNSFRTYQLQRDSLKKQGYSDKNIIKYFQKQAIADQKTHALEDQASATRQSGEDVANSGMSIAEAISSRS